MELYEKVSLAMVDGFLFLPGDTLEVEEMGQPERFWPPIEETMTPSAVDSETGETSRFDVLRPVVHISIEPVAMSAVGYQKNALGVVLDREGIETVLAIGNVRELLGSHLIKVCRAYFGIVEDKSARVYADDRYVSALAAFKGDQGNLEFVGFVSTVEVLPADWFEARIQEQEV